MQAELRNRLPPGSGLRDQRHVRFGVDQRCDTLAKKRMIVDRENPDRLGIAAHEFSSAEGLSCHFVSLVKSRRQKRGADER